MEEDIHRTYKRSKIQEDLTAYTKHGSFIGITDDEYDYCDSFATKDYPYETNDCIVISKDGVNRIAKALGIKHLEVGDDIDFYFEDDDITGGTDDDVLINNYEIVDRRGDSYILQATGDDNLAPNPYKEI